MTAFHRPRGPRPYSTRSPPPSRFGVPAVFASLEASAAHDPLCSPRALAFFVQVLTALVPRDQIMIKLGAREEQVLDHGQVLDLVPTLFQAHVFDLHKLYPTTENTPLVVMPFFLDLQQHLGQKAAAVEPDPISLRLRVKLAEAVECVLSAWPAATQHCATETRRAASRLIQKRARGVVARRSHDRKLRASALQAEKLRIEREFRRCDVHRDGILNLEIFQRMIRTLDVTKTQDDVLDDYELAVDASRRYRDRNKTDFDDESHDPEDHDALVVSEVVHVLTQPRHLHVAPPPPTGFAVLPAEPDYVHNIWGKNKPRPGSPGASAS